MGTSDAVTGLSPPHGHLATLAEAEGLEEKPTPMLVVDLDAMERNIGRMAAFFAERQAQLRPHTKHHKCTEIARLQVATGAVGVTCATTDEVAAMVRIGLDVLLANVVTDRVRLRTLAESALRGNVITAVDSVEAVRLLDEAVQRTGARVGVVIDLDIGMGRNGVRERLDALKLARYVRTRRALDLRGVMAYEGHVVAVSDRRDRRNAVSRGFEPVAAIVEDLVSDGLACDVVTGGSTATYDAIADIPFVTEVQAGSYVLMDASYAKLAPEFEPALVALATVTTSRRTGEIVVDIGSKRLATDYGTPILVGKEAAHTVTSEEHNQFQVRQGHVPRVGERVALIPGHACTTMSMYREAYGCRKGRYEHTLALDARDLLA